MARFLARISAGLRGTNRTPGASVSAHLSTWVGITSAMIGGFLGLETYRADVGKKVDQSVSKTFEIIQAFNEPALLEARLRVLSYVDAKRYCDARIISRELVDHDFVRVIDFFDLAHACVDARLCDAQTAQRFFAPYANYQWPVLTEIVDEWQTGPRTLRSDAKFAEGMAAFALDPVEAPPCNGNF